MRLVICGSLSVSTGGRAISMVIASALAQMKWEPEEIVSGCAWGADMAGESYAEDKRLPIKRFPADWGKHGKRAGYLRNLAMVQYADAVLALWDGTSRGTKLTIELAEKAGKPCKVVIVKAKVK